ncbi:RF-1 domain peptide chain release factor [Acinetobacter phage 133]|uniref:Uncharacterized protein n=1 Tax=Acinetobacter phage 133 TaxID=2919552 RepID=D9I667_9CAUD|nr:RF-1 domain peptide chain release factor [Acinetobacter phage 133]ADJ19448.1 hypothetical protein Acj133p133 [Acinetobacter phage 133]
MMNVLDACDIRVEWYRTGRAWTELNRAPTGCRLTHIPSGLTACCGTEHGSVRNKNEAMSRLEKRVAAWLTEQIKTV